MPTIQNSSLYSILLEILLCYFFSQTDLGEEGWQGNCSLINKRKRGISGIVSAGVETGHIQVGPEVPLSPTTLVTATLSLATPHVLLEKKFLTSVPNPELPI